MAGQGFTVVASPVAHLPLARGSLEVTHRRFHVGDGLGELLNSGGIEGQTTNFGIVEMKLHMWRRGWRRKKERGLVETKSFD